MTVRKPDGVMFESGLDLEVDLKGYELGWEAEGGGEAERGGGVGGNVGIELPRCCGGGDADADAEAGDLDVDALMDG